MAEEASLMPEVPDELSYTDRVRLWMDVENSCHQMLLAGLRREIGPDGDLQAAYRRWYEEVYLPQHDEGIRRMVEGFNRVFPPTEGNANG